MFRRFLPAVFIGFFLVSARAADVPREQKLPPDADHPFFGHRVPKDLDDCFSELEKNLKPEDLKDLKEGTEGHLSDYYFLGMGLRNGWGLWAGSRLAKYFNRLGIYSAEDMSGIILTSFWRHLNNKPIDLDKQIALRVQAWKDQQAMEKEMGKRSAAAQSRVEAKIRGMMMKLTLDEGKAQSVKMPPRVEGSELSTRFMAPFRDGVLLAVRGLIEGDEFDLSAYYLDLGEEKIHPVFVREIAAMHAVVVAGDRAWFLGRKGDQTVLLEIGPQIRRTVPLPQNVEGVPQLGLDGEHLLLVYRHAVFRRDGDLWVPIYEGTLDLPRSGPPPTLLDGRLFFRDEGSGENNKRLQWLTFGPPAGLRGLDEDMNVKELSCDPGWGNCFSYCVTPGGELWATMGEGFVSQSLARRAVSGEYQIAIVSGGLRFHGSEVHRDPSKKLCLSAIAFENDALLLAGRSGLYELRDQRLRCRVAFTDTQQNIPIEGGKNFYHWEWDPSHILRLGNDCYLISGDFGGVYLLKNARLNNPRFVSLDQQLGETIEF